MGRLVSIAGNQRIQFNSLIVWLANQIQHPPHLPALALQMLMQQRPPIGAQWLFPPNVGFGVPSRSTICQYLLGANEPCLVEVARVWV